MSSRALNGGDWGGGGAPRVCARALRLSFAPFPAVWGVPNALSGGQNQQWPMIKRTEMETVIYITGGRGGGVF